MVVFDVEERKQFLQESLWIVTEMRFFVILWLYIACSMFRDSSISVWSHPRHAH